MEFSDSSKEGFKDVKLIKNPLPVPKKGVMRPMEFDREFPEEELKFDYETLEGDDFDF